MEGIVPLFRLTLENTYYSQGFFNVTVDFDRFIRPTEGPVELVLGTSGLKIESNVNRRSNQNESARIMGGSKLRDWFQENYSPGDVIDVDLSSFDTIRTEGAGRGLDRSLLAPTRQSASQRADREVPADEPDCLPIDDIRDRSIGVTRSGRPHPRAPLHPSDRHWSSAT